MNNDTDDGDPRFTKLHVFTCIVLFVLLAVRFPITNLISNFAQLFGVPTHLSFMASLIQLQRWTFYFYESWAFILIGLIIVLNRNNLQNLNIDQYFLVIFWTSGLAYAFYYFWPLGWAALLISLFLFVFYIRTGYYIYGNTNPNPNLWQTLLISVMGLLGILLMMSNTTVSEAVHWSIVGMPFVVIEEVTFRGLLWMFLRFLRWTIPKIIVLQAILFWLFHAYHMFVFPILFWIIIPIMSSILGIMVWRYKSITPSTIVHILFNFSRWLLPL